MFTLQVTTFFFNPPDFGPCPLHAMEERAQRVYDASAQSAEVLAECVFFFSLPHCDRLPCDISTRLSLIRARGFLQRLFAYST